MGQLEDRLTASLELGYMKEKISLVPNDSIERIRLASLFNIPMIARRSDDLEDFKVLLLRRHLYSSLSDKFDNNATFGEIVWLYADRLQNIYGLGHYYWIHILLNNIGLLDANNMYARDIEKNVDLVQRGEFYNRMTKGYGLFGLGNSDKVKRTYGSYLEEFMIFRFLHEGGQEE